MIGTTNLRDGSQDYIMARDITWGGFLEAVERMEVVVTLNGNPDLVGLLIVYPL